MTPKIQYFIGTKDLLMHLETFHAQTVIYRGTNVVYFKMFVGTLTDITLKWFSSLADGVIKSFDDYTTILRNIQDE